MKSSLEEFRPSLYRDSAARPAEWFGSNAASCTCSSLPSLKRINKFHSLLIYSIHIGQHLHSFCFGNFRKVLPSLHSMKFSPMYLYLHNSLTHQYMFTILLPLIMGSILIISALYRGSLLNPTWHSVDSFSTWNVVADINFSSSGKRWNIHNNVSSVEKLMKFTMASWDTYILHPEYSRGDWIWWEFFILELLLEKWTLGSQHHFDQYICNLEWLHCK